MADNAQAPFTGSGTADVIVATDQVSGTLEHIQLIKLAYSADGVRTLVTADANGLLVNLGSNNDVTVSGTVTANLSATDNAVLDTIDAVLDQIKIDTEAIETAVEGTLAIGDSTSPVHVATAGADGLSNALNQLLVAAAAYVYNGSTFDRVREGAVAGSILVDGSGVTQPTGGTGESFTSGPAAVSDGADITFRGLREGIQLVVGGHLDLETICNNYTTAQTNTVLKTVNAGERFCITMASILVDSDTTPTSLDCEIEGTTTDLLRHPGITPGSGPIWGDGSGIIAVTADGADLEFTCEVPTDGSVQVMVTGFITAD